ncbi:MAG: CrcB family protein [Flavobacteriales bacterium]|nr:CrcB family protein [Flavobacteriales bacterium]MCX7649297.1 CrcB family protein [Flavobacteriales bacterium]MDW8431873.1 CrcB family protein [Flavobacteriales bacterium]
MSLWKFLAVFLGGGAGSTLRYWLAQALIGQSLWGVPLPTLLANLLASGILGLVWLAHLHDRQALTYVLLASGFCGGLSTFSTFAQDNVVLMVRFGWGAVALNILFNVTLCTALAYILTRQVAAS